MKTPSLYLLLLLKSAFILFISLGAAFAVDIPIASVYDQSDYIEGKRIRFIIDKAAVETSVKWTVMGGEELSLTHRQINALAIEFLREHSADFGEERDWQISGIELHRLSNAPSESWIWRVKIEKYTKKSIGTGASPTLHVPILLSGNIPKLMITDIKF